jgi:hypothetical protein
MPAQYIGHPGNEAWQGPKNTVVPKAILAVGSGFACVQPTFFNSENPLYSIWQLIAIVQHKQKAKLHF